MFSSLKDSYCQDVKVNRLDFQGKVLNKKIERSVMYYVGKDINDVATAAVQELSERGVLALLVQERPAVAYDIPIFVLSKRKFKLLKKNTTHISFVQRPKEVSQKESFETKGTKHSTRPELENRSNAGVKDRSDELIESTKPLTPALSDAELSAPIKFLACSAEVEALPDEVEPNTHISSPAQVRGDLKDDASFDFSEVSCD